MGRGVNTGALSPVGGIGEIRMRANLRKIVALEKGYWSHLHGSRRLRRLRQDARPYEARYRGLSGR